MSETKQHPLEKALDIDSGSTPPLVTLPPEAQLPAVGKTFAIKDPDTGEMVEMPVDGVSDDQLAREERIDDLRVDEQLTDVHNNAKAGFQHFMGTIDNIEPRYAARHGEVAAQFLGIALESTKTRTTANYQRKKMRIAAKLGSKGPSSVQNNLIVADRNDVLKQLFSPDFEKTVAEVISQEVNPLTEVEKELK